MPLLSGSLSHTCASWEQRTEIGLDDRRPAPKPVQQVHALKGRERGIPPALLDMARQNVQTGRKTLILVNRIQPALHFFCADCGRVAACPSCGGALQSGADGRVLCRRCAFRDDAPGNCRRCGRPLETLHDISIESLAQALERGCGEEAVLTLTASDLKDAPAALDQARERPLVIATLAALSPFFHGLFAAVVWVKPESFFSMEEFNAAEMIHACGAEIASLLGAGGELHVFSVFHFHYALQYLMDEEKFFDRELKYRRWFLLPPFSGVYELELRADRLRSLAATMRELYGRCRDSLNVRRIYLLSRLKQRGSFRGVLELHADAGAIAAAGLQRIRRSVLRRTAG
jgi:primosomal protein N'